MLLKYSQTEKRTKPNVSSKQQRASGAMKLTVGLPTPRVSRKVMKGVATKRTAHGQQRLIAARTEERTTVDPCDNSNDSGLGFDHHLEFQLAARSTVRFADQEAAWANEHSEVKRKKLEIKLESDDANDDFSFPETMSRRERREESHRITRTGAETGGIAMVRSPQPRPQAIASRRTAAVPVTSQAAGAVTSRNGKTQLQIVCQPETQHRARYQTEGSRGAVKDRSGNGFPVVKLTNYTKPATLEVFIGTDVGRVQPHMFYQACRVSGKNSTPCVEKKIEGTVVIEVDYDPAKDYIVTCDCVGILKERNVDVEHRFPNEQQTRNKKKSTRCRMVFRTKIVHPDGSEEWLQITSHPIVCTQPPGVPEICKKSLSACPSIGGLELFILGKNFLKDTRVVFQHTEAETPWEESVQPDKEFLQQTHLVCVVPPYRRTDITESVTVRLAIMSSGKTSEPHNFTYTPAIQQPAVVPEVAQPCVTLVQSAVPHTGGDIPHAFPRTSIVAPGAPMMITDSASTRTTKASPKKGQYLPLDTAPSSSNIGDSDSHRLMMWQTPLLPAAEASKIESKMTAEQKELDRVMSGKIMPPPPLLPIARRRASSNVHLIIPDSDPASLKTELAEDANSRSPEDVKVVDLRLKPVATVNPLGLASDLSNAQAPTLATFQRFVTGGNGTPLPTQSGPSVEKYLSNLEHTTEAGGITKPTANCIVSPCKISDTVTQPLLPQQQASMPMMYNTQNTTECKSRFAEEAPLLQQVRRKSAFEEALNIGANSETVIGRRHMVVLPESQTRNALVSSMDETVSSMIGSVANNSSLMMYTEAERTMAREDKTPHLSALVSHIQPSESDKLDALVNSAAVSHMIPTPSSTDPTSPIPVKKMSLDPPSYNLMSTCNQMLSAPNAQLNIDASNNASNVMFTSHDRTSPIAVKSIISSSAEGQIILTSSSQNSPGAGSMMDTLNPHGQVLTSGSTSPIAVKKMMETHCDSQLLSANPNNTNAGQILNRTSPIAIKSIIEQVGASVNPDPCLTNSPPIAMKTILNSEVGETLLPTSSMASANQGSSQENIRLNALIQQENMLTGTQVTSADTSGLNVLIQTTLSNHSQQNSVLTSGSQAASAASADGLVQSTLSNQPQAILASSAHVSAESARLNAIAQSALNSQNQTQILVTGPQLCDENTRLNSLTQSLLSNQAQQQSVLVPSSQISEENSRLGSFTQPLMNAPNQQATVMASNTQVNESNSRLATLTQSLMNGTSQPTVQVSDDARLSQLTSILNSQGQQQTVQIPEDSSRLTSLTQSILNSQSQQQTVLVTGVQSTEDNTRLDSLRQSIQQAVMPTSVQITENNAALNSLTQSMINSQSSGTVLVSSAAMCEQSAKLRSYTQSLLNNQSQQQALIASAAENTSLNALVQPSLANHRHQDTSAQTCIPTIVTQASQPLTVPPVTASEALLNTIFATNQNPTVQTPTTVIVGSGSLLEGTRFTTSASESQVLMTGCTVTNKQPATGESSGFMTQMLLGLAEEKMKKDAEMAIATRDKDVSSSSVQQKQEKTLQPEGATVVQQPQQPTPQKKSEEGMVPQELAQMSENDLLSYINPSTFDQGF